MHGNAQLDAITDEKLWAQLDAANASAPALEEREASDVAAHLVWAGFDLKRARAVVNGRAVGGWLHTPDLDEGVIGFTPHKTTQAPAEGDLVRIAYGRGVDGYVFESELEGDDDGTWLLELPTAIGARGPRMTGRTLGCGVWFLRLDDAKQTEVELHDLSVAGIGLLVAPGEAARPTGDLVAGWLFRLDGFVVPVSTAARRTSSLPDHPAWRVTGCSLSFVDDADRAELARVLSE